MSGIPCRIAVVGNGFVPLSQSASIDRHDLVIRFNGCRNYRGNGGRVDVLVLSNTGPSGQRLAEDPQGIDAGALEAARTFWLTKSPTLIEAERDRCGGPEHFWVDYSAGIINRHVAGRPWEFLDDHLFGAARTALMTRGATGRFEPSTGILALFKVKQTFTPCEVELFGFTHEGWDGHAWDAERLLIREWGHWISYGSTDLPQKR